MTQAEGAQDGSGEILPVRIMRTVPAPPTVVWRAFTDPNALTSWFWPARLAPRYRPSRRSVGATRSPARWPAAWPARSAAST